MKGAPIIEQVDKMVESGRITEEEADHYLERLRKGEHPKGCGRA